MRRAFALVALAAALLACGGPAPSKGGPARAPTAGEGTTCPLPPTPGSFTQESCPANLLCVDWSPYGGAAFGVCRVACSQGCATGESCGTDGSCQCQPAAYLGGSDDSCVSLGLICHPDFHVCLAAQQPSDCSSGESYAQAWTLCRP